MCDPECRNATLCGSARDCESSSCAGLRLYIASAALPPDRRLAIVIRSLPGRIGMPAGATNLCCSEEVHWRGGAALYSRRPVFLGEYRPWGSVDLSSFTR